MRNRIAKAEDILKRDSFIKEFSSASTPAQHGTKKTPRPLPYPDPVQLLRHT
jgi:hypothetical protein